MPPIDISWWIQVIEVPVLAGLFLLLRSQKTQIETTLERHRDNVEQQINGLRENLAEHKLEVAQNYTSISYIRDLEARLTNHLIRIEEKIEG